MNVSNKTLYWIFAITIVIIALIGGVFTYIYNKEKTPENDKEQQASDYAYGMMITCYVVAGVLTLIVLGIWLWNKFKGIDIIDSSDLINAFALEESLRTAPILCRDSTITSVREDIQLLPGVEGASYLKASEACKDKLKSLNIEGDLTLSKYKSLTPDEKINVFNDCFKPNFVYETYPSGRFKNITRTEKLTDLQGMLSEIAFSEKNINSFSTQATINQELSALQQLSSGAAGTGLNRDD